MRTERIKHSKSWPKVVAKKWLNIKDRTDEFESDHSINAMAERRERSCSDRKSCVVPEEFSENWMMDPNDKLESPKLGREDSPVTDPLNLRMFVGTWNVGGKSPHHDLNLSNWLRTDAPADIYVLGFQEIVPLNAGNVLGAEDNGPATKWLSLIREALNTQKFDTPDYYSAAELKPSPPPPPSPKRACFSDSLSLEEELSQANFFRLLSLDSSSGDEGSRSPPCLSMEHDRSRPMKNNGYSLAASKQMVGLFLCVWVRSDFYSHITNLEVSCVGRGIMGYLGNKGSISISMTLHQATFCFVCTHLASGQREGDEVKRNLDVTEILKKTKFLSSCRVLGEPVSPHTILDHDKIIWLGDLNYRLASSCGDDTHELLKMNDWQALLEKDQLKIEQRAGRIFEGWEEGRIYFAPTYKYHTGSDCYVGQSPISKEKQRTPAWCDRILWKGEGLKQILYERVESKFSDHRPVHSLFSVEVSVPNKFYP